MKLRFTQAQIDSHLEKWAKISRSTDPIDRSTIRSAVDLLYSCGGLRPPKDIVIVDSPLILIEMSQNELNPSKEGSTGRQILERLRKQFWHQVRGPAWGQFHGQIRDQVKSGHNNLRSVVAYSIIDHPEIELLDGMIAMLKQVGWFAPRRDKIIVSERPIKAVYRDGKCALRAYRNGFRFPNDISVLEELAMALDEE